MILDPHGSHPGSLFHEVLAELDAAGFCKTGRVHVIDLNTTSHIVPINFLAHLDDTDVSVLSDALLQAVERVWGDEDTHQKPAIRSNLKAGFMALAELGLPLTDAKFLFDPDDTHGVRARALTRLKNEYALDQLTRLDRMALADRTRREFNLEVRGPINRLNEFVSSEVMRAMLGVVDEPGQPRRTFDLLHAMDNGHIILCNLQHGGAVSEADTDLLAALLLRYLFLLASRRRNREPFFLFADECHRYLTGDVPNILAECRKYGIAAAFGHQFLGQLGKPDDLLYQALFGCTEIHVVFRVKSPRDAQALAERDIALSLERPIKASIRPTVVGHRRVHLASRASARHEGTTEGEADTEGHSHATTTSYSRGESLGSNTSQVAGSGEFSASGESVGTVMSPPWQMLGPNAATASPWQYPLSESTGTSASQGTSHQSATIEGTSRTTTETWGEATTSAHSRAHTRSASRSKGTSEQVGEREAFEPVYADLPTTYHSKENELYFAGEMIRALPVGRAFISWRGRTVCIQVPEAKRQS
jgi:hypothetical protein